MFQRYQKHWPSLLGAVFVFIALITLLKYSLDVQFLTDTMKIGAGLLAGAGFVLAGVRLVLKSNSLISELCTGLGVALLYMTCSFAGIFYSLWDPMVVLLSMIAVTVGTCIYAIRFHSRLIMSIGLIGGLISPIMMQPETDQVFSLFLYLLVMNAAFFYISVLKSWFELRLISFIGTWFLYAVYFILFQPHMDVFWSKPFRYALAAYLFYVIALFYTSYKDHMRFNGLNLYLGISNAVIFGLWALGLLTPFVSFAVPLFFMGVIYTGSAWWVYRLMQGWSASAVTKLTCGTLLMMVAMTQFGKGFAYEPMINVFLWVFIAVVILFIAKWCAVEILKSVSMVVWGCVGLYWYVVTWSTPRGEWFGVFIPFLNWGAVAWMVIAALGFYMSLHVSFQKLSQSSNAMISNILSLLSHLVVGGLLTVQVQSLFKEYDWGGLGLTLSVSWSVYSLLLFLWGAYSKQRIYRIFGTIVLCIVAGKTILFDLAEEATIYKVIVFLVLGAICFAISYINSIWNTPPTQQKEVEDMKIKE